MMPGGSHRLNEAVNTRVEGGGGWVLPGLAREFQSRFSRASLGEGGGGFLKKKPKTKREYIIAKKCKQSITFCLEEH